MVHVIQIHPLPEKTSLNQGGMNSSPSGEQRHGYTSPLRLLMGIVGLYSLRHEQKIIRTVSMVYHVTCCILSLMVAISAIVVFLKWLPTVEKTIQVIAFPVVGLYWYITQTINSWIIFYICNKRCGIEHLYEEIRTITNKMRQLGFHGYPKKEYRLQTFMTITASFMVLVNTCVKLWDITTNNVMDPIFGSQVLPRLNLTSGAYLTLKFIACSGTVMLNIQWMFQPVLFTSTCYTLWTMMSEFNKHFNNQVDTCLNKTIEEINVYRTLHLQLSQLIQTTSELFKYYLANTIKNIVAGELILLYSLSTAREEPWAPLEQFTLAFWILSYGSFLFMFVFFSQNVQDETGEAYDDLLNLMDDDTELTVTKSHQIQLFISKTRNPEGFTMAKVIDVNKELGFTVLSVMITYYLVMVQFNG